jgi:hypothetical protein
MIRKAGASLARGSLSMTVVAVSEKCLDFWHLRLEFETTKLGNHSVPSCEVWLFSESSIACKGSQQPEDGSQSRGLTYRPTKLDYDAYSGL